jgi:hypothetical protein
MASPLEGLWTGMVSWTQMQKSTQGTKHLGILDLKSAMYNLMSTKMVDY